jgi:isochorismate hydrolase
MKKNTISTLVNANYNAVYSTSLAKNVKGKNRDSLILRQKPHSIASWKQAGKGFNNDSD